MLSLCLFNRPLDPVDNEEILRYAHSISSSFGTAAPAGWTPGAYRNIGCWSKCPVVENPIRPFPQEFEMAGSTLMKLSGETFKPRHRP